MLLYRWVHLPTGTSLAVIAGTWWWRSRSPGSGQPRPIDLRAVAPRGSLTCHVPNGWDTGPLSLRRSSCKPAHSLFAQSYWPREMTSAPSTPTGGAGALARRRPSEPAVYRSAQPIWANPNLPLVWRAAEGHGRACGGAQRDAGIPYELGCVQPFARGRIAFLHNGFVTGWQRGPARLVREGLGDAAYQACRAAATRRGLFRAGARRARSRRGFAAGSRALRAAALAAHLFADQLHGPWRRFCQRRRGAGRGPACDRPRSRDSVFRGWSVQRSRARLVHGVGTPLAGRAGPRALREVPPGHLAVARRGSEARLEALS